MTLPPLHRIATLQKYLTAQEVAMLLRKSKRWVTGNKSNFKTYRPGKQKLLFELSSVLEYYFKTELSLDEQRPSLLEEKS